VPSVNGGQPGGRWNQHGLRLSHLSPLTAALLFGNNMSRPIDSAQSPFDLRQTDPQDAEDRCFA